jgi:hypothetical protein
MLIEDRIASMSHLVEENAQPHRRRHHSFNKLRLGRHGQRLDALLIAFPRAGWPRLGWRQEFKRSRRSF